MLEVRNLTKVYSGKGGVSVRALDDVSVVFPEKGMVFLLGKSGSGKSTLLNVAGGLDKPDSGEIIVKGRSSKDFSAADFDSYRNTFIGFVFQEYNILSEFTIEQNIALALQLQSKPNDKAAVDALLAQVGMEGYGKRKPNTLSGGQKQRVAIARALIKQPEIIMADEPTGALDSTTGKQVLDTLKDLSKEKLVIVVSHDRDFAEYYADRIIELKDGKILSDVTKTYSEAPDTTENVSQVSEDTITIKKGEEITDEDVRRIARMLRQNGGEAVITTGTRELPDVKRACRINDNGSKESFKETGPVEAAAYDGKDTKFIKSRLPMSRAVKMGAGSLKTKPIRLIFTIILAVAAFVLFGVVSTFMLYDPDYSMSEGLKDAGYTSMRLDKTFVYKRVSMQVNNETGEEEENYTYEDEAYTLFGASEVAAKNKGELRFAGIFTYDQSSYKNSNTISIGLMKGTESKPISLDNNDKTYHPIDELTGFTDCGKDYLTGNGFRITGEYPTKPTEIMLSEYFAELFVLTEDSGIAKKEDLVGKKVRLNGCGFSNKEFTVSGIVYTGEIPTKYDTLKTAGNPNDPERKKLALSLEDYIEKGFETLVYVSDDFYETYSGNIRKDNNGTYVQSKYITKLYLTTDSKSVDYYLENPEYKGDFGNSFYSESTVEKSGNSLTFRGLDGKVIAKPTLGDNEMYIPGQVYNEMIRSYLNSHSFNPKLDPAAYEEIGSWDDLWNMINNMKDGLNSSVIKTMQTWYPALAYRSYLYDSAYVLNNIINNKQNDNWMDSAQAFGGFNDPEYVGTAEDTDLTLLQRFIADHMQVYYGYLAEYEFNRSWTDEFVEASENPEEVIRNLKNGNYSDEEFATRKVKIDAWFARVGRSLDPQDYFAFDNSKEYDLVLLYCLTKDQKVFAATYQKIVDYVNNNTDKGGEAIVLTAEDWAAFENAFKSNTQLYYSLLLRKPMESHDSKDPVLIGEENAWDVINNLQWNNYSESQFAALKPEIEAFLTESGYTTELKDHFSFNVADGIADTMYYLDKNGNRGELAIVGYIEGQYSYYVKDSFVKAHGEEQKYDSNSYTYYEVLTTNYVAPADIKYNSIISLTNNSLDQISAALDEGDNVKFHIDNAVAEKLDEFLDMIGELGPIFLYVGLGVGFIAALFLLNFISVSIAAKRKDIGILRAVGARGSDVFKIFYAEAFIIAIICFILACVGSYVLCFFLNRSISEALSVSLLNFGPINGALILGISIFISLIATFFPVYFAAKKSPVESIRAL
ncbi:MAG: ATP-binding cassette domain-containing protein [Clostridia bacterium]|nr:ATP-binding cassette domain-containing protein [Clostridia bacterium]